MQNSTTNQTISRATLLEALESEKPARSAWDRAVQADAVDLVAAFDALEELPTLPSALTRELLNGASDWDAYSWGGCALVYDTDIAEHYCTPSELKRTRGGERRPNASEEWLDVQARALRQACKHVCVIAHALTA